VVGCPPNIRFVDTPTELRAQYQYFTQADVTKLRHAGFDAPFHSLEDGVRDYLGQLSR
jgi:ADP-L-glycero-D-manno-heptose 6-epimerase